MVNFFKNFGKGVLYVLVLPFLLVGMAIYGVVAFFIFVFLAFKGIILFFTGRSLYEDLPEDIEAKKRLNGQPIAEQTQVTNEDISSALNNSKPEEQAVNTADPFYVPEYLKQEEAHEEMVQEEIKEPEQEAPVLEEQEQLEEETPKQEEDLLFKPSFVNEADDQLMQEDEILLEKTEQKSNILEIKGDDEDEEESSGVNIDFE